MLESVNRRRQRGLSLVEVLVGLAIGLLVVACGALLLAQHLREHRALLIEARLLQDLRTAVDVVARDLRRAGHWADAAAGLPEAALPGRTNPYAALAPAAAASDAASFAFSRDVIENHQLDSHERFGFRLRNRTIEMQIGGGSWQALTDATMLAVTTLRIVPTVQEIELGELCSHAFPVGSTECPARQQLRSLRIEIAGRSVADSGVVRNVQAEVRLRNDALAGACPA